MPSDEDEISISENLLASAVDEEQEDEIFEEEVDEAEKYIDPDEILRAIIEGVVDGQTSLNRLAVTKSRIVFYSKGGFLATFRNTSAIFLEGSQIVAVQGKKGILMGEISVSTRDGIFRFKRMAKDDVDLIANMIHRLKKASDVPIQKSPVAQNASQIVKEKETIIKEIVMIPCKYCGSLMPQTSLFCPNCGAKRTA